jgi:hypothetical protein
LLAVVDHVEHRLDLLADARPNRGAALRLDLGCIDRIARDATRVEVRQRSGARQAPGMGRENAMLAALPFVFSLKHVSIIWHHLSAVIPDARLRAVRNP